MISPPAHPTTCSAPPIPARAMVTRYGFSERMGPVVYGSDPGETFLGRDFGQGKGYSENDCLRDRQRDP